MLFSVKVGAPYWITVCDRLCLSHFPVWKNDYLFCWIYNFDKNDYCILRTKSLLKFTLIKMFTRVEVHTYVMMTAPANQFTVVWTNCSHVQKCIRISYDTTLELLLSNLNEMFKCAEVHTCLIWQHIGMSLLYFKRNVHMCRSAYLWYMTAHRSEFILFWSKFSKVQKCIPMSWRQHIGMSLV